MALKWEWPFIKPRFPHEPARALPQTVAEQQVADRLRFDPNWCHAYAQRPRIPRSDVGNYAYSSLGLVELSPIGWGELPRLGIPKTLASNGKPLVYYQSVPVQGVGGLIQGQLFMQPLYDPNAQSY
jgi:hypothetical protein